MIPDPDDTRQQITEPLSKMTEINKKKYIANVRVLNYLLQEIPNDIYNLVDAYKTAQEMWERIKSLMCGSDVTNHVRHLQLMDELEKFAAKEGESLESVYERLTTLVNIMDRNNVHPIPVSINTKFLNCSQPKCWKYVIMVRHNQTGDTVSYDQLYFEDINYFKDFENQFPAIIYNDALTPKSKVLSDFKNEFPAIVYNVALASEAEVSSEYTRIQLLTILRIVSYLE
nr:hypothetical protein [Tanacetum cinerariifolium]